MLTLKNTAFAMWFRLAKERWYKEMSYSASIQLLVSYPKFKTEFILTLFLKLLVNIKSSETVVITHFILLNVYVLFVR